MVWASFPPLGLWPLAWVALMPWLLLIRQGSVNRHSMRMLFIVSYVTWLAMVHWVRLPHLATYVGWFALCLPLAGYFVAFFWLASIAVHRWRCPLWLAGPIVWCGVESLRSWLFTGFAMMLFGHTQANVPMLIQVSDFGGPHAVSFVLVMFAALLAEAVPQKNVGPSTNDHNRQVSQRRQTWFGPVLGMTLISLVVGYGYLRSTSRQSAILNAKIALVQGSIDTTFTAADKSEASFAQYLRLAQRASRGERGNQPDLVVWPESMFGGELFHITADTNYKTPDQSHFSDPFSDSEYRSILERRRLAFENRITSVAAAFGCPQLIGTLSVHLGASGQERYNTALWINAAGEIQARYDKVHPVMFGEYIPFGEIFPSLYKLIPLLPDGLSRGKGPQVVRAGDLNLSPCICFENSVPHLIRRQVRELEESGTPVHGLITMTNDGWFWGSSLLDVHLACGIFRAVENRRSMLIAANTGFSAHVDQFGTIVKKGPRRDEAVLFANAGFDASVQSVYTKTGDWLGLICSLFCMVLAAENWLGNR